ncbi:MAG: NUDIX domain-containing protein [Peptococcaceae bacterium]|nr:NUDIX domain-containing protein [Peptococcaceae bacterium]
MEHVLVVPNEQVQGFLSQTGFVAGDRAQLEAILVGAQYLERNLAEGDPRYRQLIPYVVVLQSGLVLTMQRLKAQSESRLHMKLSCGVGGHINPCDGPMDEVVIMRAATREVEEEVYIQNFEHDLLHFVGFINDDSTAVSRDHLGCVYLLNVQGLVEIRETDMMTGAFLCISELRARFNELESWSQLILPKLENGQV